MWPMDRLETNTLGQDVLVQNWRNLHLYDFSVDYTGAHMTGCVTMFD